MTKPRFYPINREGLVFWFDSRLTGNVAALGTMREYSGKGNHGTLIGDAYVNNQGLQLDGVGDCIQIPDASSLDFGSGAFTVVVNFKTSATDIQQNLIVKRDDYTGGVFPFWLLRIDSDNVIRGQVAVDASNYVFTKTSSSYSDGNMHNLVMTYSSNNIKLYVDSVEDSNQTNVGSVGSYDNTNSIYLGITRDQLGDYVNPFQGTIKNALILNRALTAQEIKRNYERLK